MAQRRNPYSSHSKPSFKPQDKPLSEVCQRCGQSDYQVNEVTHARYCKVCFFVWADPERELERKRESHRRMGFKDPSDDISSLL